MKKLDDQKISFPLLCRALCVLLGAVLVATVVLFCSACTQAEAEALDTGETEGGADSAVTEQTDAAETPSEETDAAEQADPPAESDTPTEEEKLSVRDTPGNVIIINELTAEQTEELCNRAYSLPCIRPEDYVELGREQLLAHYGIDELDLTTVLDGFTEILTDEKVDEATGEAYTDTLAPKYGMLVHSDGSEWFSSTFEWKKAAEEQFVTIEFGRDSLPWWAGYQKLDDGSWVDGSLQPMDTFETSTINGVNVLLYSWVSESGRVVYNAEFLTNGVGAELSGNTGEDEFLAVVAYVLSACQE